MEQGRDHLDEMIYDSFEDIETLGHNPNEYKSKLMDKLNGTNKKQQPSPSANRSFHTAAVSLITAGILLGVIYTTGMQDNLINLEYKLKTDYAMIKSNIDFGKLFIGE